MLRSLIRSRPFVLVLALAMTSACADDENPGPESLLEPESADRPWYYLRDVEDAKDRECRVVLRTVEPVEPTCVEETCWMSWRVTFDVERYQLIEGLVPGIMYQTNTNPDDWWLIGARQAEGAGPGFQRFQMVIFEHTLPAAQWEGSKDEFVLQVVPILTLPSGARILDLNRDRNSWRHNPLDVNNDWSLGDHPLVCTGEDLWALEPVVVDQLKYVTKVALAVDTRGRPHVLYYGQAGLQYTWRDAHGWTSPVTVVNFDNPNMGFSSYTLVLDNQDLPHIAYCRVDKSQEQWEWSLIYLRPEGQTWQEEELAGFHDCMSLSLALDSRDVPQLAWVDSAEGVIHSRRGAGGWESGLAASEEAYDITLGIDRFDRSHLVYFGETGLVLLDRMEDGSWVPGVKPDGLYRPREGRAVFDTQGRPHLGMMNYQLEYTGLVDGGWLLEVIDDTFHTGLGVSIAVHEDGSGNVVPMMAYCDTATFGASFAWKRDGQWFHVAVDLEDIDTDGTAIAIDPDGRPHIVYKDHWDDTLDYATYVGPAF